MRRSYASLRAAVCLLALCAPSLAQGGPGPGPGPAPLPPAPVPVQNPQTPAKIVLGKILFWDEQLSSDNSNACGSCHLPTAGGGDDRLALHPGVDGIPGTPDDKNTSLGVIRSDLNNDYLPDSVFRLQRQATRRAAPTMIMAAYAQRLFWDGRAGPEFIDPQTGTVLIPAGPAPGPGQPPAPSGALEAQAIAPPLADAEMAHEFRDWPEIIAKLAQAHPLKLASNIPADMANAVATHGSYPNLFQAAFGTPAITAARIAMAIAAYERTLIPNQTPWDQFNAGNQGALTQQEIQGLNVFRGIGNCDNCHVPPFFTNFGFRNVGLRPISEDAGRNEITGNPGDRGRFKVPTLRNVELRDRFMHTGEFSTLAQVVNFYADGPHNLANIDPLVPPITLNAQERNALVAFLGRPLTDPRVAQGLPPFDRPTLWGEVGGNPILGNGRSGTGGITPAMIAQVPANLANPDFKVGLARANGLSGTLAVLALNTTPAAPGSMLGTVPLSVAIDANLLYLLLPVQGTGPGAGYATARIPLPDLPILAGTTVYGQWFVQDGGAGPLGWAASRGAQWTVF